MKDFYMKHFLPGLSAIGILSLSGCVESPVEPPNFLIIFIDDMGSQDIGFYGQQYIETPAIDRLASEGMRWTNAYSSSPVCSPTRVALLTGKNPARVNFTGHIPRGEKHRHPPHSRIIPPNDLLDLPHEELTIAEALKPLGYTSISIGKWHVGREGHWPTDMGFDYNVAGWTHGMPPSHFYPYENPATPWNAAIPTMKGGGPGEYLTDRLTDEAIKFMGQYKEKPFLLYLPHYAVHTPLQAPVELIDKYKSILDGTVIHPVYAAMVESVDHNVARLLQALDDLNLADNTVVIFASDNGALDVEGVFDGEGFPVADNSPFRSGKGHLYEGGLRVPLIIRWPGVIKPGRVSENLTITEDLFATIVDIAGDKAMPGSPLDGRSLVSDFDSESSDIYIDLHWYYPHYSPHGNRPGAAIRSGDYKLIEFYDPPTVELYNLNDDIGETRDISESFPGMKRELLDKLDNWLKRTNPVMHTMNPGYKGD